LLGKYGEEGDKLLFKILNSGDFLAKADESLLQQKDSNKITSHISEKGLRYDLTVPFARFVVQHRNEVQFPFKRYQIQPVWRADKPQKGRYREFYQCDVDVIGSDSLLNEVELIQIVNDVYSRLNIRVVVKMNNRKILAGIAEVIGQPDKITDITVAIDKLDKIGIDNVNKELAEKGLPQTAIDQLQPILNLSGNNSQKLDQISKVLAKSETGLKGIAEMQTVFDWLAPLNLNTPVELDLTLARGLNYYTGAIFEVKALDVQIGSITGGGRYDDLTGIFGLPGVSGVGISFGADRIYDVMEQLNLYPESASATTKVLFVNFGIEEQKWCLQAMTKVRQAGISCEIYPEPAKMKKQMAYADGRKIPFVAIVGENEIASGKITVKDMTSGEQKLLSVNELIESIKA
jgi:histidyl-tRNA synthetase